MNDNPFNASKAVAPCQRGTPNVNYAPPMIDVGDYFAKMLEMTVKARNRLLAFSIIAAPFIFLTCLLLFWDGTSQPSVGPLPHPNSSNIIYSPR